MKKKFFSKALAAGMAFCMLMPTTALAATTYSITVELSGPDAAGVEQFVSVKSSKYGSKETPLAATVVQMINDNYGEIEEVFAGTGLRGIVDDGLAAYGKGKDSFEWETYDTKYGAVVKGDFKETLRDLDATFDDLEPNVENTITFTRDDINVYEVTVTLNKYTTGGGGGGSSDSATTPEDTTGGEGDTDHKDDCAAEVFGDLNLTLWYHDGICYCVANGLMAGFEDGTFGPYECLTRAQIAQMMYNIAGKPEVVARDVYDDVDADAWYAKAITWATDEEVVFGYSDEEFAPNQCVTREQLVAILYRYAGSPAANGTLADFSDADSVSKYAAPAMQWATENGLISGSEGKLNPQGKATRAEAASFIMRYCEFLGI